MPKFEIVTTRMGVLSIRENTTQEIMHNPVGPWVEANSLYIEQSRLHARLAENTGEELVIFDVGLGAAANALATLHCARSLKQRRPLRIISFERDLELLEFALTNAHHFAHFKGFETALRTLLTEAKWSEPGITWELRYGHFPELIKHEPYFADLVFYDPYSSKKNLEMWVPSVFRDLRAKVKSLGVLYTYSRATPVRVGLLLAGFLVGEGVATGAKEETTQASPSLEALQNALGRAWLDRWKRSHQANALGDSDFTETKKTILTHPQFENL